MAKLGSYSVMGIGKELKRAANPYGLIVRQSKVRTGVWYIQDPDASYDAIDIYSIVRDAIDDCDCSFEYHGSTLVVKEDNEDTHY